MVDELNLEPRTQVKVQNIDVEVLKGNLAEKPWLIDSEGEDYILLEKSQYDKIIELLTDALNQNLEYKMEQKIFSEMPVDLEDVKVVLKQELSKDNTLSIDNALKKIRKEYPNLFHKIDFESVFENLF